MVTSSHQEDNIKPNDMSVVTSGSNFFFLQTLTDMKILYGSEKGSQMLRTEHKLQLSEVEVRKTSFKPERNVVKLAIRTSSGLHMSSSAVTIWNLDDYTGCTRAGWHSLNALDPFSVGAQFESWWGHRLLWLRFSMVFLSTRQIQSRQNCSLSNYYQFTTHQSSYNSAL
jgi:hypothetical protein